MINILCYGDSNTYGFIPAGGRYNEGQRWTRLLQRDLGESYYVIEEGLNGRTTVFDDPDIKYSKGIDYLEMCISSHEPLDLVVLMLGTNDAKVAVFNAGPCEIAQGIESMIKLLKEPNIYNGDILIISPIHIRDSILESEYVESFGGLEGAKISRALAPELKKLAKEYKCYFLDAADYAKADDRDAIHLGEDGHKSLANALAEKIKSIYD